MAYETFVPARGAGVGPGPCENDGFGGSMSAGARYRAAVRAGCFTWWRRAIAAVVGTAVAGTVFFLVMPVAQAEEASPVIQVDNTADAPLASIDGSCADAQGRCTLRASIMLS